MKNKILVSLLIIFFFFSIPLVARESEKMTLQQCMALAIQRSEKVKFSEEEIKLARVQFLQALSTFVPKIDFRFTQTLQDDSANSSGGTGGAVSNTFTLFSRPEAAFSISQNLFQGLKEVHAIRGAGIADQYQQHRKAEAERLLFGDVGIV
ncbi:MAG: TolC family protein, partial [Deltaproteobacteria bacterium]|nr:TolC family protein [Deltaproteobacteria bacterium]